jgi:hypothetical protein
MKQFRLLTQLFIFAITACCISGCAGDPRAVLLEPYVETNPSPKAIVGLWNSKYSTYSTTLLFRNNGTGLHSWNKDEKPVSFTYEYIGNGKWRTSLHQGTVFKIAKGQLMLYMWPCKPQIFDRKA